MPIDPRTPVLVGAGQLLQKVDPEDALEPVDMIAEAARRAADDAGAPGLLAAVDSVRIVSLLSWRYADPGALVAQRVGATPRQTAVTPMGGNSPQTLVNKTAKAIAAGELDVALLGGAEAWRTRMWFRKQDRKPDWTEMDESAPHATVLGDELAMTHPSEAARGIVMPVQLYPIFENALRAAAGRSIDEHLAVISELWSRFSEVASTNPYAWIREPRSAERIRTASPDNRMVGFPYTKSMNSNNDVDQASAVLLCSVEAAERFGVPRDRWVFPIAGTDAHDTPYVSNRQDLHSSPAVRFAGRRARERWVFPIAGTDAHDTPYVSNRQDLHSSPAMRIAGRRALELAGVGHDDVAHVDLYSCFPSAVEIGATEIGFGLERQLTVTGGLTFAGGPWNNYVGHSIATMANVVRDDPGSFGFCSANGGYTTKHAMGVYSTTPPADGFKWEDVQQQVDAETAARDFAEDHEGAVTIESYTVMHERDGSMGNGIVACLTPTGARTWATTTDADLMKALTSDDLVGRPATISGGTITVD